MADNQANSNVEEIQIGDIVWLRNGQTSMVVGEIGTWSSGIRSASCHWIDVFGNPMERKFPLGVLTKMEPSV